ncbi:MAG: HAD-IIIA family hydrolase, partial [Campylobacter sp.]|nr:HAD-IIIA family hydrolase [Campylobacter sp.]
MIEIIFLDVDGCLTDGGLYHSNSGEEMKKFNVKDGFGIQEWQRCGKKVAIITGKSSQIVANRAKELKIDIVFQGVKDKFAKATEILENLGLRFSQAAAIGDDLNDAKLLKAVGVSFKPKNALNS